MHDIRDKSKRWFAGTLAFATACMLLPTSATAQSDSNSGSLDALSLRDLMQVRVTSASRKSQTLSHTAAAAYVVSAEDIRRSGATSIPEALRLVPGLEVAQIGSSNWAITARGFNGLYANKLLVLIDGRTVYTPLFSGVFWSLQDTMMEDIDHIEVIRGPGAAMWGANAVNGVINIITKKARDTQGNLAVVGAGNQERGFAGFRHGGRYGDDGNYRVYVKGFSRNGTLDAGGQRRNDGWKSGQTGFRLDRNISSDERFTLQGDAYQKIIGDATYPQMTQAPFNTVIYGNNHGKGLNLLARWEGNLASGSEYKLQTYYDRVGISAPTLSDITDTVDVDFQHRLHPNAGNDLMWGFDYRYIHSAATSTLAISYAPASLGYHNVSTFMQDDIALLPDTLRLTLGSKLEHTHFGGTQFQPNVRMLWTPDATHSIWAALSRASRTPSRGEAQSQIALGVYGGALQVYALPNPNLQPERVTTAELGYRTQVNSRFSYDVTAFSSRYSNLIQWRQGAIDYATLTLPLTWSNASQPVFTHGLEVSAEWDALDWMRLSGAYSYLRIKRAYDGVNYDTAGLSPRNHGSLRCQLDLSERSQLDLIVRHVNRLTAVGQGVPAYTAFDAHYGYTLHRGLEFSLTGQNLFAPQHLEYNNSSTLIQTYTPNRIPRSIYAKITWHD